MCPEDKHTLKVPEISFDLGEVAVVAGGVRQTSAGAWSYLTEFVV